MLVFAKMRRTLALLLALILGAHAQDLLHRGVALQNQGEHVEAGKLYETLLSEEPRNADALHLLGLVHHAAGNTEKGIPLVEQASKERPGDANILTNLGEMLRSIGAFQRAKDALELATSVAPTFPLAWRNRAVVALQTQDWPLVEAANRQLFALNSSDDRSLLDLADAVQRQRRLDEAMDLYAMAFDDPRALLGAGVTAQHQGDLNTAEEYYARAAEGASSEEIRRQAKVNRASVYHERGEMETAISQYRDALETYPNDTQALNNLGAALVTVGRHQDAVQVLEECLLLDPQQPQALTNLATHYANEGDVDRARLLLKKARKVVPSEKTAGLLMREVTMMRPMPTSLRSFYTERAEFAMRIAALRHAILTNKTNIILQDPVSSVEQVHFYLPYTGLNDRFLQEALASTYQALSPDLTYRAPHLENNDVKKHRRRRRIGFLSKYFGEHEPHGLLLEGVVQYLPRDVFDVVLLPIASPGRPAASELLRETADEVIPLGLNFFANRLALTTAELDVVIFADLLSEPMSYFLAYSRVARIQIVFWGNPVTAGRPDLIDYFISADRMEDRSRVFRHPNDEPYSEQVVLLDGQGIWYRRPRLPGDLHSGSSEKSQRRRDFFGKMNVTLDGPLLICPQSNFKLHPFFDDVVRRILLAAPSAKILFTEGRRDTWTVVLKDRLRLALGNLFTRIIFIPRQKPGDDFLRLVALADVMLHPFPFGGSRTSSDGLAVGVPVVTRPTRHLRGRMAYSFYATMDMLAKNWTCVAGSADEYVTFAAALANDPRHRERVAEAIVERSPRIWEDHSVVDEWARFLKRVTSVASSEDARSLGKAAVEVYEAGRLMEAATKLRQALDVVTETQMEGRLRSDLGATLQQLGDFEGAEVELRRSLELNPNSTVTLNNLAVTLHEGGSVEKAVPYYNAALESSPTALFNAANAHRDAGDVQKAVETLKKGLQTDVGSAVVALFEPANHLPEVSFRQDDLLMAANSLVVMADHLGIEDVHSGPWTLTNEPPPTAEEMTPLGGVATGVHLIVQPFRSTSETRRMELAFALEKNLKHPHLTKIHALVETPEDAKFVQDIDFTEKLTISETQGRRLTFAAAAKYAEQNLPSGSVVAIANADIFFDESLLHLGDTRSLDLDKKVLALTRWEWTCGLLETSIRRRDCVEFHPRIDSQDVWIFRTPLTVMADVELGRPRCDNHIAALLAKNYQLSSPSLLIRAIHIQTPRNKTLRSYTSKEEIKGASRYIPLSDQLLL